MEPATKRGRPSRARNVSATLRALVAAARLSSTVRSARPHSSSRVREAWNELVSTTSAPASKYVAWIDSSTSGRVRLR